MYPKTRGLALSASFAVLLGIFSLVSIPIPFDLVPVTLQVMGVFLIAALLGPYYGTLSCLIYLMFGAVGLPVFHSGTSGIPIILGLLADTLFPFRLQRLLEEVFPGQLQRREEWIFSESDRALQYRLS